MPSLSLDLTALIARELLWFYKTIRDSSGKTEVTQLHDAIVVNEDVSRFDISVHQTALMEEVDTAQ